MPVAKLFLSAFIVVAVATAVFGSSSANAEPDRPLIFLPGILGSKLVDEDGDLVWGDRRSYRNFRHLTLPNNESDIKIRPNGVIDAVTIVWPFKVKQYGGLRKTLEDLGYVEGQNLFIFAYDWRRSNYKNAHLLQKFIEATPALQSGQFDLIAHSMGGIVSLILIHEQEAGQRVRNYITLGTPYYGSLNALDIYLDGFSGVGGFMSTIGTTRDHIRSVMFSFESGYELLPSYNLCCVLGKKSDPDRSLMDLYETEFWTTNWLPAGFSSAANQDFVREGLARGKQLRELIKEPIPSTVNHYMFAGDKYDTRAQVYFEPSGDVDEFTKRGGDGTVWLNSATRNKQQDARVSFKKHATIFDDKKLKTELGWILTPGGLENYSASVAEVKFTSTAGNEFEADLVYFETSPVLVTPGATVTARMELRGASIVETPEQFEFNVCADISETGPAELCKAMIEMDSEGPVRSYQATFEVNQQGDFTAWLEQKKDIEDYFSSIAPD